MFFRILKNDLRRKRTINIILILFIILSTILVASGINNVLAVLNGTDYFLDKAGIGDYAIITMGDNCLGKMESALKEKKEVTDYRIETIIYGSKDNVKKDGKLCENRNTSIFQAMENSKLHFFNSNNEEVTKVEKGHVYATGNFIDSNNLKIGDKINIKLGDVDKEFILDGKLKDAFLGSSFMGNARFIMNEADYKEFLEDETVYNSYQGEIGYINTNDMKAFAAGISDIPNVVFEGSRTMIKITYVMELIVAFLVLILSVCLMVVSFVVLKFSINLTITEEFREIGGMKAIGMKNKNIRSIYLIKYLSLSIIGSVIGFFISIPLGNVLLQSATANMVLGTEVGILPNIVGAVVVGTIIPLYAYHSTRKIKKASPIDAIRSGQTGERYKQKNIYKIEKSHVSTNLYMALNDVISSPKKYFTIILSFLICTALMLVIVNTTATMKSDKLVSSLSSRSDLYITDVANSMKYMSGPSKEDYKQFLKEKEEEISKLGMPAKCKSQVFYKYKINFNGNEYLMSCDQGVGTKITDYDYEKGTILPTKKDEILITTVVSELTGAKIGDIITIDFETEKLDCVVTGYYESMNLLGQVIRLHDDAPTDFSHVSSIAQIQVDFTDSPSEKEIENRKNKLIEYYDNDEIMNVQEYCIDCVGVADTFTLVQYLLLGITLVVVLLVTILMERSFIADEKSQIAILKAVGFKDRDVIAWHTYRFTIVSLIAVVIASILSMPLTQLCISPIFKMMGNGSVSYNFDPLQVFLIYPGIVVLSTMVIAFLVAQYTRKITCRDTSNIE